MTFVSSRSRSILSLSSSRSLSSAIHRSTAGAVASRSLSQHHSYDQSQNEILARKSLWGVAFAAASATAGISLLGISSSSSQTLCDGTSDIKTDSSETSRENPGEILEAEPEIDKYDNLPEKDEPTHCSICLTYRKGPCRPYWRKVEACTKDGEKELKKKEDGGVGEDDDNNKDDKDSSSSMSESTRCFKYMMPWIDCASKYRNFYTLIEMDTNYTEGIQDLEATSRHFCWVPGQEPKIDWSNWQQSSTEEEEKEKEVDSNITNRVDTEADVDADAINDLITNVALWKTLDPALGDPELISIEAEVPATINSGLGILECAYAVDQDNNVIGFAYGTKPSDLIDDENKKTDDDDNPKAAESDDGEKKKRVADNDNIVENGNEDMMVTLNIQLLASRTQNFVLAASYTHRIEGLKSSNEGGNNSKAIESHLYKSKPFDLANIPKLTTPPLSQTQENNDGNAGVSPQVSS